MRRQTSSGSLPKKVILWEIILQEVIILEGILQESITQNMSNWKVSHWRLSYSRLACRRLSYLANHLGDRLESTANDRLIGLEGYRQPKVPTLIMYDENDPTKFKWGGQVDWRDPAVRGVKLMLDPDQERPIYVPAYSLKKDPKAKSKAPVDIAGDFIGAIYEHALSVIQSRGLQEYFDLCQKDFILSVPAAWSDKAKDLTLQASTTFGQLIRDSALADLTLPRQAAKKAGIHPVTLIKEPEAAALYTLTTHEHAIMVRPLSLALSCEIATDIIT